MIATLLMTALEDAASASVDACTLNNALNAVQLALLVAVVKWLRDDPARSDR